MRGWLATWLIAGALFAPAFVLAYVSPGVPSGFVNDFADVLTVEEEHALELALEEFEQETAHEIAVVAIASLDGDDIESYANALFREWGVGKADKNNGVLFLMALDDRKMRIEVGYGLEGALTDTEAKEIIDTVMTPRFKASQYAQGIEEGVDQIMREARGETIERAGAQRGSTVGAGIMKFLMEFFGLGVIVIVFVIFRLALATVSATMGKSPSWWQGGVLGAGAWALAWSLFSVALWTLVLFVGVGLLWDFMVSRMWKSYTASKKKKHRWLFDHTRHNGGGSGGGRGFGGGGGGGFGGGSSGGGGASGGW